MFGLQHETAHIDRMGFDDTACHGIKREGGGRPATEVAEDFRAFLNSARDDDTPFYAQVGFFETHTPYTFGDCPPDDEPGAWIPPYAKAHDWAPWKVILNRFGGDPDAARRHIAELQGSVLRVDAAVETILDGVRKAGVEDNTLVVFSNWIDGLNFSARTSRYKLIRNLVPVDSTGRECPPYELYDLELDPLELTNVADEPAYAEAYNTMRGYLDGWLAQMDDPTVHGELTADEHEKMIAEYRRRYEESRTATAASA